MSQAVIIRSFCVVRLAICCDYCWQTLSSYCIIIKLQGLPAPAGGSYHLVILIYMCVEDCYFIPITGVLILVVLVFDS